MMALKLRIHGCHALRRHEEGLVELNRARAKRRIRSDRCRELRTLPTANKRRNFEIFQQSKTTAVQSAKQQFRDAAVHRGPVESTSNIAKYPGMRQITLSEVKKKWSPELLLELLIRTSLFHLHARCDCLVVQLSSMSCIVEVLYAQWRTTSKDQCPTRLWQCETTSVRLLLYNAAVTVFPILEMHKLTVDISQHWLQCAINLKTTKIATAMNFTRTVSKYEELHRMQSAL
jgi:hypothetical protein